MLLVVAPAPAQIASTLIAEEIEERAVEAYVYGLQQVVFYETRYTFTQNEDSRAYVGTNRLGWQREPIGPEFREIVTPNATTFYGSGFFDLSEEPLVVELPSIADRYWSFQAMDQYGDYFFYAGNQFTGTEAQTWLLVGPGDDTPLPPRFDATRIVHSPTSSGFMIVRHAFTGSDDGELRTILAYQDRTTTTPLGAWRANGDRGVPYADRPITPGSYATFPRMAELGQALVENQTGADFFRLLSLVLNDPTLTKREDSLKEARTLHRLREIGLREGFVLDPGTLPEAQMAALESGFSAGRKRVKTALQQSLVDMNGWMLTKNMGQYGTDYLTRAVIADAGWAGPGEQSHTGAFCFRDSLGRPLSGEYRYKLAFRKRDLPPVTQFWSVPIYDAQGYFVENPIDRYTVNSFMYERGELSVDNRGELAFYIQTDRPTDNQRARNWLPAPQGEFRLTARFYGPRMPLIDGSYAMPAPERIE